jgi:hypothetical protein
VQTTMHDNPLDLELTPQPVGLRLDLACLTGLDTDLILGPPAEPGREARARIAALADMISAGFISAADLAHASFSLTTLAAVLDDDETSYDDEELLGGCAA